MKYLKLSYIKLILLIAKDNCFPIAIFECSVKGEFSYHKQKYYLSNPCKGRHKLYCKNTSDTPEPPLQNSLLLCNVELCKQVRG